MKTKITLLVLTALLGLTNVFANSMPSSENIVENEIMTTGDNSIIISAGKRIYTLDMNTYNATLLATSPYVNEINSIASDATTGWIFYVSNHISRYNWTIYGYNVYTNTHKNFGSVRNYFTSTGHANSSRGLASGGATFYNGKLYFAMEYPTHCYYNRDGRSATGNQNPKDELGNNVRAAGTVSNTMFTNGPVPRNANVMEADEADNGGREGDGETATDFETVDDEAANVDSELLSDYIPEEDLPADATADDGLAQRGTSNAESYNYYSSSYNNRMYLLEISFNGLSDASGSTASVSNGRPVYDNWGYSSFLYRGELGDIVVDDNGQLYAATSYQVQAYNFNSNRYDWANNEDVYAQMAKDKNSALQLLKNKRQCNTYYYNGCPHSSCTTKSFVQSYTAPSSLRRYNQLQIGSLNEITGLNSADVGKITDASDYVRLTPPVSYKIKGFVFDDNDENGNYNSGTGETKLSNIQVTLYADNNADGVLDAGDTVLESQNTNATGNYTFNDVQVASTLVQVTVPSDDNDFTYTLTTADVVAVTGATSDITGIKFGINKQDVVVNVAYDVFGTVYDDNNENATLEAGENGLANVTLTLYADTNADGVLDAGDTVITTTTSGTDGSYSFLHVCIQNTIVAVTVPTSTGNFTYTLTTAGTQAIDSINTNVTGVDFGINEAQVINYNVSGTVFDDDNANGTLDTGEETLEGITVTLYADTNINGTLDAGDTVISSANTIVTGVYNFANVTVENTIVEVTVPTDTGDFTYTLTTAGSLAASSTTSDVTGLDFGINKVKVIDYNIAGTVFDDNNTNGVNDAEAGLDGLTITLYSDNDASGTLNAGDGFLGTTTTATDGTYSFANVTIEFTLVAVTVPSNTAQFLYTPTTATMVAVNSATADVNGVDFGINKVEVTDYNITGTVFDDDNANGVNDAEGVLENVTVTLYNDVNTDGALDAGDTVITTTTTIANGTYIFPHVAVNNTVVAVTVPTNTGDFTYTLTTAGDQNTSSATTDVTGVDFGINKVQVIDYNIAGTVFDDDNTNGVNDAEAGLDGLTITLYSDNDASGTLNAGDGFLGTTTTATDGTYSFANVTTEFTLVAVTVPSNTAQFLYTPTTATMVAVNSTTADVNGVDFGIDKVEIIDYSISGNTFMDNDEDGNYDTSNGNPEGPFANVVVRLYEDTNADGSLDGSDDLMMTTASGSSGTYQFGNVNKKNTLVKFTLPSNNPNSNFRATTPDVVSLLNRTSNVSDVNFGIFTEQVIDYNISGTVFDDNNESGVNDAGDGVLDGITVTLYADNNQDGNFDVADTTLSSTTTDVNGNYSFANITTEYVLAVVTTPGNTATQTYVLTTANTQATNSTTTDVTGLDFGINEETVINYNISGTVFDDNNVNGVRDAGEGFIGAALITLYADTNNDGILDAGDTVIGTTTTGTMSGNYGFTGVTVMNTIVQVTVPGNTTSFTFVPTTPTSQAVSSTITDVTGVDFGIDRVRVINYNISGTVFDDDNANGTIDEAGRLANVTLTLYADTDNNGTIGGTDTVLTTTTSATDGTYTFSNVTTESTLVQVTVPTNDSSFTYTLTTAAERVTSSQITDITGADFGINQVSNTYAISGNVFNDVNADGINTEGGLNNVTVNLYADLNGNGRIDRGEPLITSTTSDRNGNYQFTGITNVTVVVQILVPSDTSQFTYVATTPISVALSSGTTVTNVDFGIQRSLIVLFNVNGLIWSDENADTVQDATELRLEGIGVTLYRDVNGNGVIDAGTDTAVSTVFTSQTGVYQFTNVNFANGIIAAVLPSNATFTTSALRSFSSVNTDVNNLDFGMQVTPNMFQVTGVVFDDDNENGVADAGEGSLDGLAVEIYADTDLSGTFDPNFDILIALTQTSNGGFDFTNPNYIVDNIPPGQVFVVIVIPAPNPPFESWTPTYDPDSGTANPDGVFPTIMTGNIAGVNFGINYVDLNSTSRDANAADTMYTNTAEDVSERLRLYPNPTVSQIAINAEEFAGDVTVEIYNDRGYRVMTTTVSPFGNEVKVDVQRLAPGMYYAKFGSRNKVASKKFIKR